MRALGEVGVSALVVGGGCGLLFENEFVKGYCAVGAPEVCLVCWGFCMSICSVECFFFLFRGIVVCSG